MPGSRLWKEGYPSYSKERCLFPACYSLYGLYYIESHLQEPLTVRMLSQKLGISESHLSTIFKKEIGRALTIKFNLKSLLTVEIFIVFVARESWSSSETVKALWSKDGGRFTVRLSSHFYA